MGTDYSSSIIDRFESWVNLTPDNVAIYCNGETLTFRQLHGHSSKLALQIAGLNNGSPFIGLSARKTADPIVGLLSIIKAGKAYLPLDPTHPMERLRQMVEDSGITHIVCEPSDSGFFEQFGLTNLFVPNAITAEVINEQHELPGPGELVALLYTSGSTGIPKGVCLTHKGMHNIVEHHLLTSMADSGVQLLTFAHLSFDVSFQDIFTSLTAGGTLHVIDDTIRIDTIQLLQYIDRHAINMADLPYVTLQHLCETAEQINCYPSALKEVTTGGELVKITPAIRNFFRTKPDSTLTIAYGPTECSVSVTDLTLRGDTDSWQDIPSIGHPVTNTTIWLLDTEKREVPMGEVGEIHVGGVNVAQGYLNREALTTERFINWTTPGGEQERLYCTGDLGLLLPSGEFEFRGRIDNQVKIQGNRVELGEIEVCLAEHPNVSQNVVVMREDVPGLHRLVAYVVAVDVTWNDAGALRAHLEKRLPNYMIPNKFVWVHSFPKTASGKVELRALPTPDSKRPDTGVLYRPPHTEHEKIIASLWSSLLSIDQVGIDDNFFDLGGNSLIAVKMMVQIERKTGERLPISSLIEAPSIRKLAGTIDRSNYTEKWKCLVPIKPTGSKTKLYIVHGGGMNVLSFYNLVEFMDPEQPVFGLQAKGLDGITTPSDTVEDIARDYIKEIIEHNPNGPYALSGYSSGGIVAMEMANQLKAMGRTVSFLGLIDTSTNKNGHEKLIREKRFLSYSLYLATKMMYAVYFLLRFPKSYLRNRYLYLMVVFNLHKDRKPKDRQMLIEEKVANIHNNALDKQYKLEPYNGHVHIFKATRKLYYTLHNKTNGWEPYLKNAYTLIDIPASHLNMFDSPQVMKLAKELQKAIDNTNQSNNRYSSANLIGSANNTNEIKYWKKKALI